ncbi:PfkB family carbohydrate kinase [Neobacillus pocheonensis]|uniref:PfkB family carbohydrate kinase n=1 Tax=Neobacillus pocheonensis TaxID=363869 RepID=A0ABT0W8Y7_9BACI|nr:PfkB family carbohydrate kinase [Neobacillus pocheonensis]
MQAYSYRISHVEYEDPRIDFENRKSLSFHQEQKLIEQIDKLVTKVDAIIVTDQFKCGVVTPRIREVLIQYAREGLMIAVDSRNRIDHFTEMILKPNELETMKALHYQSKQKEPSMEEYIESARSLAQRQNSQVCMTLGEKGAIWIDKDQVTFVPSQAVLGTFDIVGAGDCFMSSFVSMLAAGFKGADAIAFAHLAASIVVKKIGMTGTANPSEIHERWLRFEKS